MPTSPPGSDRQEQPDPEEATDQAGVAPETGEVDRRGVREQHEREGDFGQVSDRRRLDVDVQHIQHHRPKHEPNDDERERGTDRQFVETVGDERVAGQEQGEGRDADFQVVPPGSAEKWSGTGGGPTLAPSPAATLW